MSPSVQDVGVNHCCLNVLMPKQFLDRADVIPALQQMSGKAVPEGVTANPLRQLFKIT